MNAQQINDLRNKLLIYQESYREAETQRAREHYHNLCVETYDKIEELENELSED